MQAIQELVIEIGNRLQDVAAWVVGGPQIVLIFLVLGALAAGGLITAIVAIDYFQARQTS